MSFDQSAFATEMLNNTLWWRCSVGGENEYFELSGALQDLFAHKVQKLDDLTGQYTTPVIPIKMQEILNNPMLNIRFAASFDTAIGQRSFQHRLRVFENQGVRYVWAVCIEITEMVAFEREIVDAQGRLSLNQVYEREAVLVEKNKFINDSYQKQSRFLAMLSHELRSPLLGISSLVERLQEQLTLGPITAETLTALKTIHVTAEQSIFLVNDILTYSQTEYDVITLHPMAFSLKELLENVKQLTKSIASDKNLMVSMVYLGERDLVVGDSVRLAQILINLIVNSLKFTQFGGVSVEVTEKASSHFLFKVTDSGEGISEEQKARIFEPFEQLESVGSGLHIGSGLGLFIVKKLVNLMNGSVTVESNLGVGTSFLVDIVLPSIEEALADSDRNNGQYKLLNQSAKNAIKFARQKLVRSETPALQSVKSVKAESSAESALSRDHYQILVADDSKINRMVLAGYLENENCTVIEAKDGRQAWELFQEGGYGFVFLDIQMPFLDGIEVSQKILKSVQENAHYTRALKGVYAITASGDVSNFIPEGETLGSIGFDGWFVKPITQAQIVGALQARSDVRVPGVSPVSLAPAVSASQSVVEEVASDLETGAEWDTFDRVPEPFHGLMDSFLAETTSGLAEMFAFNQAKNHVGLSSKAHYLKGNCMLFQLDKMADLLKRVEELIKEEKTPEIMQEELDLVLKKIQLSLKYLENSFAIRHNGNQ